MIEEKELEMENQKLGNIIDFYMLANNLKYIITDKDQSVADQVYGAIVLSTAINSEYDRTNNLGTIFRMLLLGTINEYYHEELSEVLRRMNNGDLYSVDLCEYYRADDFGSNNGIFAFNCMQYEHMMSYFFEKFLKEENIKNEDLDKLYNNAKNQGLLDYFGNDEKKNYEIFRFYYLNRVLRKKDRSGWDSKHWNVSSDRIEKISEHIVGTIALATVIDSEFDFNINLDRVLFTLGIHEIGEISIGDITPFDGITPEQKEEIEHQAIISVVEGLTNKQGMIDLIFELDDRNTEEAKYAHYCDKLEADIQAKVYQDMGFQHPLTEQENNVVFKSSKVQKMVEEGAKTAFDIWYNWDKPIYIDSKVFAKTLEYINNKKLK